MVSLCWPIKICVINRMCSTVANESDRLTRSKHGVFRGHFLQLRSGFTFAVRFCWSDVFRLAAGKSMDLHVIQRMRIPSLTIHAAMLNPGRPLTLLETRFKRRKRVFRCSTTACKQVHFERIAFTVYLIGNTNIWLVSRFNGNAQ